MPTARGRSSPEDIRRAVESVFGNVRAGLEHLVSIPSVSVAGYEDYNPDEVRRSAEQTGAQISGKGASDLR